MKRGTSSASRPRRSRPRARATSARPTRSCAGPIDGKVIVRTGPPHPGRAPGRRHPRADLGRAHGGRRCLRRQGVARGQRRRRSRVPHRAHRARASAGSSPSTRSSTRAQDRARRSSAARSTRSARSTRACSRKRWTRPRPRYPDVAYEPQLIDATYALLISSAGDPLVIPSLNRDGDCLSDLVMQLFGSIAGAESVLMSFDADAQARRRDGRSAARHRAAPVRARTSPTRWR